MGNQVVAKQDVVQNVLGEIRAGLINVNSVSLGFTLDESANDLAVFIDLNNSMNNTFAPLVSDFGNNLIEALMTISNSVTEYKLLDDKLSEVVEESLNSGENAKSNTSTI